LWHLPAFVLKHRWLEFERRRFAGAHAVAPAPAKPIPWLRPVVLCLSGLAWVFSLVCLAVVVARDESWEVLLALPIPFVLVAAALLLFRRAKRR